MLDAFVMRCAAAGASVSGLRKRVDACITSEACISTFITLGVREEEGAGGEKGLGQQQQPSWTAPRWLDMLRNAHSVARRAWQRMRKYTAIRDTVQKRHQLTLPRPGETCCRYVLSWGHRV